MSVLFGLDKGQGAGLNWNGYQSWISELCVGKKKPVCCDGSSWQR